MGYVLHITRKEAWSGDDGDAIEPEEWLAAVARIGGLEPITRLEMGSTQLNLPAEWLTHRWNEHPEYPGAGPTFSLTHGNVSFGGSDTATLHLAFEIAEELGARIVGDEGEEYDPSMLAGPTDEAGWETVNPFTRQRLYQEREGVLEKHGNEWHLVTPKRALFGLGPGEERALLFFVAPLPDDAVGRTLHLRGTLSEAGKYGRDRSCQFVFYALEVAAKPAS